MNTFCIDGTAGNDANSGADFAHAKRSVQGCANADGTFAGDTTLIFEAGTQIAADTNQTTRPTSPFRTPAGASLTLRAHGGGARPHITCANRGFQCLGSGSADYQDVDIYGAATGNAVEARTGGGTRLVNVAIHGFNVSVKCGTGAIVMDGLLIDKPASNGVQVDAAADQAVAASIYANDVHCIAGSPTVQDLFVLHDGGYGVRAGALLQGIRIEALAGCYVESGIDIQQQFKGTTLRDFSIFGASQWGIVMGSLYKGGSGTYTFATKSQMLAAYNREGIGSGATTINAGHCAWVTSDGGNNGLWQLTGSDPNVAGSWTGPMTADDIAANPNLIYQGIVQACVAGVQVQHPGTQIAGVSIVDITGGNWVGADAAGSGQPLAFYDMGYGCAVEDCVVASSNSKYPEIGSDGKPTGNLLSSVKPVLHVKAIHARIAQRQRVKLSGSIVRQRLFHTGPVLELLAAADRGYIVSDYCAYTNDNGLGGVFAADGGTDRTFAAWKTSNGNSDAHSQWDTAAVLKIDDACRLLSGSPLIGAGVARSGLDGSIPAVDAEGNTLSSPPDIGAYRYLSPSAQQAVRGSVRRALRAMRTAGTPPVDTSPPDTPAGLALGSGTSSTLTASWSASERATWYELRHSPAAAGAWTVEPQTTDLSLILAGLSPSTAYDAQIRAGNGAGPSAWSATASGSTTA